MHEWTGKDVLNYQRNFLISFKNPALSNIVQNYDSCNQMLLFSNYFPYVKIVGGYLLTRTFREYDVV